MNSTLEHHRIVAEVDALKRLQAETIAELDAQLPPSLTAPSKGICDIHKRDA